MNATRRAWLLLSVACLAWAAVLLAWPPAFWSLVFDDSFYYGEIARRLACGEGSTFDGIHPTNGYHPLWMVLCTAVFATPLDGEAAMRALLLLQVPMLGVGLGLGWTALQATRPPAGPALERSLAVGVLGLLLLAALSKDIVKLWVNGLESALVFVLQGGLLALAARRDLLDPGARRVRLQAGGLLAATFLARTDGALLLPAVALWALPRLARTPRATARALLALLLPPSLVVFAFMVANQAWMGFPVQVSGMLKGAPLTVPRVVGAVAVLAVPAVVAWRLRRPPAGHLGILLDRTGFLGVFAAMLLAWYACLGRFPRLWYFGPVVAWALWMAAAGLGDLLARAAAERPDVPPAQAVRPLLAMFAVVGLLAVGRGAVSVVRPEAAAPLLANRDAALHVARTLPPEAVLASWDAGVLGFYAERPVVNLDGVVQSGDFLRALRQGSTQALLAPVPIGWIVNHHAMEGGPAELGRLAAQRLGPRAAPPTLVGTWPFSVFAGVNEALPSANDMAVFLLALPGTPVPAAAWHPASLRP